MKQTKKLMAILCVCLGALAVGCGSSAPATNDAATTNAAATTDDAAATEEAPADDAAADTTATN